MAFSPWPPERYETLRALFDAGKTYSQIAAEMGLKHEVARKAGKRIGLERGQGNRVPSWTDAEFQRVGALAKERKSSRQIALIMGVTRNIVIGRCWRRNIPLHGVADNSSKLARPWSKADCDTLRALAEQGKTGSEIGLILHRSRNGVLSGCRRLGLKLTGGDQVGTENARQARIEAVKEREQRVMALWLVGVTSMYEIADQLGIAPTTAWDYIKRLGLKRVAVRRPVIAAGAVRFSGPSEPVKPGNCLLTELARTQCRWPVGDDSGWQQLFCGDPVEDLKPYCACHAARALNKAAPLAAMRLAGRA